MNGLLPISLILPTHNRAAVLQSILPLYLDLPVAEVIVVDDGSDDGTPALCHALQQPKLIYIRHETRKCQPAARNTGVRLATQPFVLMGEDDVMMDADYVRSLWRLRQELNADFVAGRRIPMLFAETPEQAKTRTENAPDPVFFYSKTIGLNDAFLSSAPFPTPLIHACALFDREWAVRFPYDEAYRGNALREESDFYLRCHAAGARLFHCSEAVSYHLFHQGKGGCRDGHWWYFWHSCRNNHRFLACHWPILCQTFGLSRSRPVFEARLAWHTARMTFLFWLSGSFPRFHQRLKQLLHS